MKLWILRPIDGIGNWYPWCGKAFSHIVRAECETDARDIAAENIGDEGKDALLDAKKSTCIELTADGEQKHIMVGFASA